MKEPMTMKHEEAAGASRLLERNLGASAWTNAKICVCVCVTDLQWMQQPLETESVIRRAFGLGGDKSSD